MKQNFPYPVLGNGDDIKGEFKTKCEWSISGNLITVNCQFETTNEYISELIKNKNAKYCAEFICSNTYYRNLKTSEDGVIEFSEQAASLKGRVDIYFYICSAKELDNYYPVGTHCDFGEEPFRINTGDILAIGGRAFFIADKSFDPYTAPINSFVKLKYSNKIRTMSVDYEKESIIIELPQEDYEKYQAIKNESSEFVISTVVLPVLIDAICEICKENSAYSDCLWYAKLRQICSERKIKTDNPLKAAQEILGNPIRKILNWSYSRFYLSEGEADE
ncbi:MAG: hypothetical protein LBH29_00115 [Elusimicrobiota bacterium]|jgi:hypothetical protein|nr:hypothetical protein [Elusimicrobiota bacterium]